MHRLLTMSILALLTVFTARGEGFKQIRRIISLPTL